MPTSQPTSQATSRPTETSPAPSPQLSPEVSVATNAVPLALTSVTFQLRLAGIENQLTDDAIILIESSCGVFLASTIESISDVSCEVLKQQPSSIASRRLLEAGHSVILHMLVHAFVDSSTSLAQVHLADLLDETFFYFGDELVIVVKNSAEVRGLTGFTSLGSVEFVREEADESIYSTSILSAHGSERVRATLWASVASAGVSIAVILVLRKNSSQCHRRRLIRLDDDVASLPATVDCFDQPIKGRHETNWRPAPPPAPPTKMVSHELLPPIPSNVICNSLTDEENPKERRDTKLSTNDLLRSYSSTFEVSSSPEVKDLSVRTVTSQNQGTNLFSLALDKQSRTRYGDRKNDCTPSSMECFAGSQRETQTRTAGIRAKRTIDAPSGKLGIIIRQSTEGCKVSPTTPVIDH